MKLKVGYINLIVAGRNPTINLTDANKIIGARINILSPKPKRKQSIRFKDNILTINKRKSDHRQIIGIIVYKPKKVIK